MEKVGGSLLTVFFLFLFTGQAYAYLDPGTGSMLLQGLLAILFAIITTIGIYWHRLKGFVGHFKNRKSNKIKEL